MKNDDFEIIGLDEELNEPRKNVVRITVVAVLAALNEEATIHKVVSELREHTDRVVVVDDASEDDTVDEARRAGAIVHTHPYRVGYDSCINDGFSIALGQSAGIIFTWDAADEFYPEDIPYLLGPIVHDDADIVCGRRFGKPHKKTVTWAEKAFAAYTNQFGLHDPLCGMKAFNSIVYRKVGYYDEINGMGTHLIIEAAKRRYRIAEVPIRTKPRPGFEAKRGAAAENMKIMETLYRVMTKIK